MGFLVTIIRSLQTVEMRALLYLSEVPGKLTVTVICLAKLSIRFFGLKNSMEAKDSEPSIFPGI